MSGEWYALHVKAHKERWVADLLARRQIELFYPYLIVRPVNPRSRRERPFFPGYLFVFLDLERDGAHSVQWVEGTHGLVQFGGQPARVPAALIAELRLRTERLRAQGVADRPAMRPGQRVRIVAGVFEGYEAVFDAALPGHERVQVLLAYLSHQPKRVQLGRQDIVPAGRRPDLVQEGQ
jgi:transcriptional antiterminator RfaH